LQNKDDLTDIVRAVKNGDTESFQTLYDRTIQNVYRTVCFFTTNQSDVDDIVQDIYLALYMGIRQYDDNRAFRPWFYGFVLNQVKAGRRKIWRHSRIQNKLQENIVQVQSLDAANEAIDNLSRYEMIACLDRLPFKYKQVMVLHYLHDFTLGEVSEILRIPAGTVKSRLAEGLAKLRRNRNVTGFLSGGKVEASQ